MSGDISCKRLTYQGNYGAHRNSYRESSHILKAYSNEARCINLTKNQTDDSSSLNIKGYFFSHFAKQIGLQTTDNNIKH